MSAHVKLPLAPEPRDAEDREAREEREERVPEVCAKLRTKMAFGSLSQTRDWRFGETTTAGYWCLRTMETWGTDEQLALPHACVKGRVCFAPPAGSDDVA